MNSKAGQLTSPILDLFSWEEKLIAPLIAALNGECTNKKTKDRAKKLDYRLHV
jgi:hypothetical protein